MDIVVRKFKLIERLSLFFKKQKVRNIIMLWNTYYNECIVNPEYWGVSREGYSDDVIGAFSHEIVHKVLEKEISEKANVKFDKIAGMVNL